MLEKGQDFEELADTYVIFITENDKFQKGLPMYHIERTVRELDNELLCDGSHIIYVNGSYRDSSEPIGKLMQDFHSKSTAGMNYPVIEKRVKQFKEEGDTVPMCKAVEDFAKEYGEAIEKATTERIEKELTQKSAKQERKNLKLMVKNLFMTGKLTAEEIVAACGLSLSELGELLNEN